MAMILEEEKNLSLLQMNVEIEFGKESRIAILVKDNQR